MKMKFLFLSEIKNEQIISFLLKKGKVDWEKEKLSLERASQYDWIISFGYRHIISQQIIDASKNPIINLHISYLPFNRGAHPNYWSFKENTPKGVSIHFIDTGIDTGPILIQKKCNFSRTDTLATSYLKLKSEIEKLFYASFHKIITHEIIATPQTSQGTFHKKSDLPDGIDWNININDI